MKKDIVYIILILLAFFASPYLYNPDLSEVEAQLAQDQIIINLQDSIIQVHSDSLRMADEAIESFQEFVKLERVRLIDSLNTKYSNMSDTQLRNAVLGNRRD